MKRLVYFLLTLFGLTPALFSQINVTIQPSSSDARIKESSSTTNYGTATYLEVNANMPGSRDRNLIIFDLSSIPAGANITSAVLSLYLCYEDASSGVTRTHDVHRVTQSWTESNVSWDSRDGTNNWSTAGGSFASTPSASQTIDQTQEFKSWTVTADVQSFVDGTNSNYGWLIKDDELASTSDKWQFRTREYSTTSVRPKLEITYWPKITSKVGGGNWSDTSTWGGSTVPGVTNPVEILSGATVTLDANVTPDAGADITVNGVLNCGTYTISGAANFTLVSGGSLLIGSVDGITSAGASGNIQTTGRSFDQAANYSYNGSSGQASGNGLPSTVNNLTLNNASGLSLSSSTTISGTLTLTSGNVSLADNNLIMADGATLSGNSGSAFVFTDGSGAFKWLACAASTAYTFPVGHTNSSAGYTPLVLTFNTGHTTDDFSVLAINSITDDGSRSGSAFTSTVVKTMWNISETSSGGTDVDLLFQWNGTDEATSFNRSSCHMAHYSNSSWSTVGSNANAGGSDPYTFSYSNYTGTFSPFGIEGAGGPLPITLVYFKATRHGENNIITWATASEDDNNFFTIERGLDGKTFETIATINGAGNSSRIIDYSYTDASAPTATNYYRLKQTDFDGKSSYSPIVFTHCEPIQSLKIYPVPVSDRINIDLNSPMNFDGLLQIINESGQSVLEKVILLESGPNHFEIETMELPAGLYLMHFVGPQGTNILRIPLNK